MDAGRFISPAPTTRSSNATCCSTASSIPGRPRPHDHWEAAAHALRDFISQRWLKTDQTYELRNPKRVYYLSMEFLIGRSLANNVTNALLDPLMLEALRMKGIDWSTLTESEPDAGLGNGGLGRLAACFIDSMATLQIPGMGYGLRYEYGIFRQSFQRRLATRASGQLAALARSLGSGAAARSRRGEAQLLLRSARR